MMQQGQMNPLMLKLMQLQMQQQQQPMMPDDDEGEWEGSDMDLEQRFGGPIDMGQPDVPPAMNDNIWRGPAPMDDTNPYMQDESHMGIPHQSQGAQQMANGYGPIGQKMERMRPQLIHDRKRTQQMFPKGIPEDVEMATQEMENAPNEMAGIKAHKKQHKFMKGHLREGIGRVQVDRGGESVDRMFQKLQSDLQKLKEQRAKRSAK